MKLGAIFIIVLKVLLVIVLINVAFFLARLLWGLAVSFYKYYSFKRTHGRAPTTEEHFSNLGI